MEFDYVIVGAGTAGSILAARLSENPALRICLIEAGGMDRHPYVRIPAGYARAVYDPRFSWCYKTAPDPATNNRAIDYPRGRVVGGSNSINGLMWVRPQAEDLDRWAQKGCRGWSFSDMLPYLRRSESYDGGREEMRGRTGPMRIEDATDRSPILLAAYQAAKEIGLRENPDTNDPDQEGFSWTQQMRQGRFRVTSARTYLHPALSRPNLMLVTRAHVRRLVLEGRRATGVEYEIEDGIARFTARARRGVILSAGAIGSPQILQLSGIGPGEHLHGLGIPVLFDAPGVGRNFQDHYMVRMSWRVKRRGTANEKSHGLALMWELAKWAVAGRGLLTAGAGMIVVHAKSRPELATPDIQSVVAPGSWQEGKFGLLEHEPGLSTAVWQHRPESTGDVLITSADHRAAPAIRPGYLSTRTDQDTIVWGMKMCRRWMGAPAMAPFIAHETLPGPRVNTDAEFLADARARGNTVYHPCSSVRMGPEGDRMSPVDLSLRLRGIEGLRVIDASVMPDMVSANINATVVMIAERAAEIIAAEARAGLAA